MDGTARIGFDSCQSACADVSRQDTQAAMSCPIGYVETRCHSRSAAGTRSWSACLSQTAQAHDHTVVTCPTFSHGGRILTEP